MIQWKLDWRSCKQKGTDSMKIGIYIKLKVVKSGVKSVIQLNTINLMLLKVVKPTFTLPCVNVI